MTGAEIALIAQLALKYGPPMALAIGELFEKQEATIEDVRKAFALAHKSYEDYEALPPGSLVQPLPPGTVAATFPPQPERP